MLKARVIPCLDVKDGRVVKGVQFVDLRDAGDPVECAVAYDHAGADELCFLDITASHENRGTLIDVVRRTAEVCFMPLTVGGGVRALEDIRNLLLAGADKVSINSAAVADRGIVHAAAEKFGESWDQAEHQGKVSMLAEGTQVYVLPPPELAKMKQAFAPQVDAAIADVEKQGKPGRKFFEDYTK